MLGELTGAVLDGRYRVLARIGEGGMGVVYRAEHSFLRRPLAIKVLAASFSADRDRVERFFREAQAASAIRHPHVIEIFDVGYTPDGAAYFVMEFLAGEDLGVRLARERFLPWPRVRAIALQICGAMQHVHSHGVIHRDLKPDNIFLCPCDDDQDFVKLLDFGIAKVTLPGDREPLTRTGEVFGTPCYMAPEHLNGEVLDERADIYAIGVILYKMLTGEVPFRGREPVQILSQILLHDAPSARASAPELAIPIALDGLVQRAMSRRRDDRFPTMAAFARALEAVEAGPSTPDPPRPTFATPLPRHRSAVSPMPREREPTGQLAIPRSNDATGPTGGGSRPGVAPARPGRWPVLLWSLLAVCLGGAALVVWTLPGPRSPRDATPRVQLATVATPAPTPRPPAEPMSTTAMNPTPAVLPEPAAPPPDPPMSEPPASTPLEPAAALVEPSPARPRPKVRRAPKPPPDPFAGIEAVLRDVARRIDARCAGSSGAYPGQSITVDLRIRGDGALLKAALPPRLRDEELGHCVREELRRASFPAVPVPLFSKLHTFVLGTAD